MSTSRASASKRSAGQARDRALPVREPEVIAPPPAEAAFEGQYRVQLPSFEGPLDLLLHLIQQHEIDILDIPVSFITEKYLAYLHIMRSLAIDVASEYLVMAATLVHIKSKMLLPTVPAGQDDDSVLGEEEDPRAELVRRLLEYQKYKAAAGELADRGTLGRDVFGRGATEAEPEGVAPFASLGVFSLLDAFEKALKRANIKIDHEVVFDRISITDRIVELTEKLSERRSMRFEDMLTSGQPGAVITRFDVVITFLAVLEMARLKLIRVYQSDPLAPIHVELASEKGSAVPIAPADEPADEVVAAATSVAQPPEVPRRSETDLAQRASEAPESDAESMGVGGADEMPAEVPQVTGAVEASSPSTEERVEAAEAPGETAHRPSDGLPVEGGDGD